MFRSHIQRQLKDRDLSHELHFMQEMENFLGAKSQEPKTCQSLGVIPCLSQGFTTIMAQGKPLQNLVTSNSNHLSSVLHLQVGLGLALGHGFGPGLLYLPLVIFGVRSHAGHALIALDWMSKRAVPVLQARSKASLGFCLPKFVGQSESCGQMPHK